MKPLKFKNKNPHICFILTVFGPEKAEVRQKLFFPDVEYTTEIFSEHRSSLSCVVSSVDLFKLEHDIFAK